MSVPGTSARRTVTAAIIIAAIAGLVVGCDGSRSDAPSDNGSAPPEPFPEITAQEASKAVSDSMLVTSQALYLAIAAPAESREVVTSDGELRLAWSDNANFVTGAGTYTLTLDGYAIPEEDPFSEQYYGYLLSGSITLRSESGEQTDVSFDLTMDHPAPDEYPARRLELAITGTNDEVDPQSASTIRVNGRSFSFEDLAASF